MIPDERSKAGLCLDRSGFILHRSVPVTSVMGCARKTRDRVLNGPRLSAAGIDSVINRRSKINMKDQKIIKEKV